MRSWRQAKPLQLDGRHYDYSGPKVVGTTIVKPASELMNSLVYDGNLIRQEGSHGVSINVEGRDGYSKHVWGETPWHAVVKAREAYVQFLDDKETTERMLTEYRNGTLAVPAVAKAC